MHSSGILQLLFIVCITWAAPALSQDTATLFHCQPSTERSWQLYTPNIPDLHFNQQNVADLTVIDSEGLEEDGSATSYYFRIPESTDLNCNGRVTAIQYCYQTVVNTKTPITIFNLLVVNPDNDGFSLLPVQATPSSSTCSAMRFADRSGRNSQRCCTLNEIGDNSDISITSNGLVFGIVTNTDDNARPLAFNDNGLYTVTAYQQRSSPILTGFVSPQQPFNPLEFESTMVGLAVMRFFIEPDTAATESDTGASTTAMVSSGDQSITTTMTPTEERTREDLMITGEGGVMTIRETTPIVSERNMGNVGGVIAAVVTGLLLLTVMVVVVVVIVLIRRHRKMQKVKLKTNASQSDLTKQIDDVSAEYAGIGPHVYEKVTKLNNLQVEKHEYAEAGAGAYEVPLQSLKRSQDTAAVASTMDDNFYVVPAVDENSLYRQLRQIKTKILPRVSVIFNERLGSGQFGVVYKGVLDSGEGGEVEVAVKTLKEGSGAEDRVMFLQEVAIMGQFKHPNVVTMYGVVTDGEPVLLVLDFLQKGDLRKYLRKLASSQEDLDDHTLLSYCRQVASGMAYLSSKAFVHRDIAARNILVSKDDICKIADFGMSRDLMNESYYISHGGKIPVRWTAPEALHYKKYSTASDVWSYGVLVYEIWSVGQKLFKEYTNINVIRRVESGYRLPPPPGCPRALYNIMISCWHPETSQRPNFLDVTEQLSLPDTKLLKWSEEDKCVHPEAAKLGADLLCAQDLYKDLQMKYQSAEVPATLIQAEVQSALYEVPHL